MIALVGVGVAGFNSIRGDIRDTETRLTQQIQMVKDDIKDTEARLSEEKGRRWTHFHIDWTGVSS